MLTLLRIRNLALVEDLEWSPGAGFVAVTGETGAGKSIILGALKLLLGERADRGLIRTGQDLCTVEAVFQIPPDLQLNPHLIEQGIEPCVDGVLILKRIIGASGPGRQFINGSPTTLAALKWVGDALVDLHGPHDHQSLFSPERQLELLDAFARALPRREETAEAYARLEELEKERDELGGPEGAVERELDLLRHQIAEIRSLDLKPEDEETLVADHARAANARRLIELATGAVNGLEEAEDAVLSRLAETQRLLNELEKLDESAGTHAAEHRSCVVTLEELASSLRDYAEGLDADPARLMELDDRIALLETLKRKYGGSLQAVQDFASAAENKLRRLENRAGELERIDAELEKARAAYDTAACALSTERRVAAPKLSAEVSAHLDDLGFKQSEFEVRLDDCAPRARGVDAAEFLFAPNPGEPAKALRAIASSGEISRVMLALKTALASEDSIALMVFDEIDANVGGEIAHSVAEKMRQIAGGHQVLVITHLPQVASRATRHFHVVKEVAGGRTRSLMREVDGEERVREVARMLGGRTDSAIGHARALLAE